MKDKVEISSNDKRHFTTIPNYIIRSGCRPNEVAVLAVIASFAWAGSKCTASVKTIAKYAGVKRNTVCDAIQEWEKRGQITVERTNKCSKITTNFDFTTNVAPWASSIHEDTAKNESSSIPLDTPAVSTGILPAVSTGIHKEDTIKKTNKEDSTNTENKIKKINEVAEIINVFKLAVNPMIPFNNITENTAAKEIIAQFGFERSIFLAKFAASIQGKDYAPTITTPYQLKIKYGALVAYAKKNNYKNNYIKIS